MKKSIYVNGIVKDSKNNMEKYLFSENERLNAIINELQERIDKAIDFIDNWEKYKKEKRPLEVSMLDLLYIKDILGDKEMNNEDYKIAYENVMIANKMLEQENKQLKEDKKKLIEYIKKDEFVDYIPNSKSYLRLMKIRCDLLEILGDKE